MAKPESISPDRIGDAPVSETEEARLEKPVRRKAATLVLVRSIDDIPHILFIRRSEDVPSHKGQISFPGGGFKTADITLEQTALREMWEEVGVESHNLRILGPLPPTDTVVSNFVVHPFVAVPKDKYTPINYQKDGFEVEELFHIPLHHLLDPRSLRQETWTIKGHSRIVDFYNYQNYIIWGVTAQILSNFLSEIREGLWKELF